jgi:hypothetical protein
VLIFKNDSWHALHLTGHVWVTALKKALAKRYPGDNPFKDRFVLLAGINGSTKLIAREVQRNGGNAILASNKKTEGLAIAKDIGCRFIAFDALYATMHDVLIVCDEEKDEKAGKGGIHTGYLKGGMIVLDLTANTRKSATLQGAEMRNCDIVVPMDLLLDILEMQARTLTGKPVARDVLKNAIPARFRED